MKLIVACLAILLCGPAAAADRTPDQILADYDKAVGGAAARKKHKNLRIVSTLTVKGAGITGTKELRATSAGKVLDQMTITGIGGFRQGSTGKIRWAEDPINGLRVLKGIEDAQAQLDTTWNADIRLRDLHRKIEPVAPPAGEDATKIECLDLTPKNPLLTHKTTVCFDRSTHLRVFQAGRQMAPQGETPYTARFRNWQDVGGVKIPHAEELTAGPMTIATQITKVEFNVKLSDSLFRVPTPKK